MLLLHVTKVQQLLLTNQHQLLLQQQVTVALNSLLPGATGHTQLTASTHAAAAAAGTRLLLPAAASGADAIYTCICFITVSSSLLHHEACHSVFLVKLGLPVSKRLQLRLSGTSQVIVAVLRRNLHTVIQHHRIVLQQLVECEMQ
jgi:hypothetical protein